MTNATYAKPCQVLTYVKSLTQSRFGAGGRDWRFTRSKGHGSAGSGIVVRRVRTAVRKSATVAAG